MRKSLLLLVLAFLFVFAGVSLAAEVPTADQMRRIAAKEGGVHGAELAKGSSGKPNWELINLQIKLGQFVPALREWLGEVSNKLDNALKSIEELENKNKKTEGRLLALEKKESVAGESGDLKGDVQAIKWVTIVSFSILLVLLILLNRGKISKKEAQEMVAAAIQKTLEQLKEQAAKNGKGEVMAIFTGPCLGGPVAALGVVVEALEATTLAGKKIDDQNKVHFDGNFSKKVDGDFSKWLNDQLAKLLQQANGEEVTLVLANSLVRIGADKQAHKFLMEQVGVKYTIIGIKDDVATPLFSFDNGNQRALPNIVPEADKSKSTPPPIPNT